MKPTPEEIAAYADGELDEARKAEVAAMVETDPELARQVASHRMLRERLAAHYAPILEQPVPEQLTRAARPASATVSSLAVARNRRDMRNGFPKWGYFAGPALAASLVLALFMGGGDNRDDGYAGAEIASALESQISGFSDRDPRVLLSFRDEAGEFCRAFAGSESSGIACRDERGWRLKRSDAGVEAQPGEYRQAGSAEADLMAAAQAMAFGPALTAAEERAAARQGWR